MIGPAGAGLAGVVVVLIVLGAMGRIDSSTLLIAVEELLFRGWPAVLWLIAAYGFGAALQRWLLPGARFIQTVRCGLGVAGLLALDGLLGRVGLLTAAGGAVGWGILVLGLVLAVMNRPQEHISIGGSGLWRWMVPLALAGPVVVLLLAAVSAPGWLWASEFGGYDVLSYHLQLPKEWLAAGRIEGLEHNVYSFLPSYMEGAFLHLAVLHGDVLSAAVGCQLLHAMMTVLAALATGAAVKAGLKLSDDEPTGRVAGLIGGALVLVTPWSIVVGSLAYSEMTVALLLAVGLVVLFDDGNQSRPVKSAIALGIILGGACGAKLTAVGFVAGPLLVVLGMRGLISVRESGAGGAFVRAIVAPMLAGVVMLGVLSPYLIANTIQTGDPVFPMATDEFGTGHWTQAQVDRFEHAHQRDWTSSENALKVAVDQLIPPFSSASSKTDSPWCWHFSIIPILAVFGGYIALAGRRTWRLSLIASAVFVMQFVFWMEFTHIKARFMTPAIIPMALMIMAGGVAIADDSRDRWSHALARASGLMLLLGMCIAPVWIYSREKGGKSAMGIGAMDVMTGDVHAALRVQGLLDAETLRTAPPGFWVNHVLDDEARVLLVGESTPLYYDGDRITYCTVWDRGPMHELIRTMPDEPERWGAELRARGYTHVLINRSMLTIWTRSRYGDGVLTTQTMKPLILDNRQIVDLPGDIRLVELTDGE
jgi:uncharacterized integral membrane protein